MSTDSETKSDTNDDIRSILINEITNNDDINDVLSIFNDNEVSRDLLIDIIMNDSDNGKKIFDDFKIKPLIQFKIIKAVQTYANVINKKYVKQIIISNDEYNKNNELIMIQKTVKNNKDILNDKINTINNDFCEYKKKLNEKFKKMFDDLNVWKQKLLDNKEGTVNKKLNDIRCRLTELDAYNVALNEATIKYNKNLISIDNMDKRKEINIDIISKVLQNSEIHTNNSDNVYNIV